MKRFLYTMALLVAAAVAEASGQVLVSQEFLQGVEGTVRLRVTETRDEVPIPYASVYLTAKGDTTIMHFTLSDTTGTAEIRKVPRGTYRLVIEMLGYKSYDREHYFGKELEDLGIIRLAEDIELLDAARVTAIGNPIEVKQDTVIFNASSFQMGQNQMLEDLLKLMPGMEVLDDGSIRYNGEAIRKITVGGKTFFFDDPKMALRNLPARIVNKVKVIDKASDAELFTGVAADREKVMDLEFRKEFQEGWFGNARLGAGTTLSRSDDELTDNRGFLYNGSLLLSAYNDKDQFTAIGNAYNATLLGRDDAILSVAYTDDDGNTVHSSSPGLLRDAQAGANYNTTRIKGLDLEGMVRYDHAFLDSRSRTERTYFLREADDIAESSSQSRFDRGDETKLNLTLKNTDRKKILFRFTPSLKYKRNHTDYAGESRSSAVTTSGNEALNRSASAGSGLSSQLRHEVSLAFGIRNLGNERRSLSLYARYNATGYDGQNRDSSGTDFFQAADPAGKDIRSESTQRNFGGSVELDYVEPISAHWVLSVSADGNWTHRDNRKDVYDMRTGQYDETYSAALDSRYDFYSGVMKLQYQKNRITLSFGARMQETYQENRTRPRGDWIVSGKNRWITDWSPYVNFRYYQDATSVSAYCYGSTIRPSAADLLPTLDISVPTRIRVGNSYLLPSNQHLASVDFSGSDSKRFRSLHIMNSAMLFTRQTVMASWFDEDGIQYVIPVNSRKLGFDYRVNASFSLALTKDKRFQLSGSLAGSWQQAVSYQNIRPVAGIDRDHFDYEAFMDAFWGGYSGERFYSGASGFSESRTRSLRFAPSATLNYRADRATVGIGGGTEYASSHYTLDPAADTRTWRSDARVFFTWQMPRGFEAASDFTYCFFAGFPQGFNEPYGRWNLNITKHIKQFSIGLYANDLLNANRSTLHIATADYVEDVQRNQLGRHFFVTFKWNFGKLNEARSARANQAVWQMQY